MARRLEKDPPPARKRTENQRRRSNADPTGENLAPLPNGRGDDPCPAGSIAGNSARRVRRHHGAVRVGQINANEPGRLPRYSYGGAIRIEWDAGEPDG